MALRLATPMDAPALVGIYGQYIHTPITFEYELPSPREFQDRITHTLEDYPYLVWEENGTPVGYAYAHRFKERAAYQWGAELSVYVAQGHTSQKVGRRLYGALMELLAIQGVRTVYGIVTVPNEKSEGLHRSMGFQDAGICRNTGYVDGRPGACPHHPLPAALHGTGPKGSGKMAIKNLEHSAGKCSRFFMLLFPL